MIYVYVSVIHISDKEPESRIYRDLRTYNCKTNQLKKANYWNRCFTREDVHMPNKHMKGCSTS